MIVNQKPYPTVSSRLSLLRLVRFDLNWEFAIEILKFSDSMDLYLIPGPADDTLASDTCVVA